MPDWTAITGIVVSGVVGPAGAAYFASRYQQRAFYRERAASDRVELRKLLDDAAVALHHAHYALSGANQSVMRHGQWVGERDNDAIVAVREAGRTLDKLRERFHIRLGRHEEVVKAFAAADEHMLEFFRALTLLGDLGPDDTSQLLKECRDRMKPATEGFEGEVERFLDLAAQDDVGGLMLRPPATSWLPRKT